LKTDANGKVEFTGFLGEYEVSSGGNCAAFSLNESGSADAKVQLT
jgi:hypothetical protein